MDAFPPELRELELAAAEAGAGAEPRLAAGRAWGSRREGSQRENLERAAAHFEAAAALLGVAGDASGEARALRELAEALLVSPDMDRAAPLARAEEALRRALGLLPPGEHRERGLAEQDLAFSYVLLPEGNRQYNMVRAVSALERAEAEFEALGDPAALDQVRANLAIAREQLRHASRL
ncbi:MAG: hypothetical protein SF028_02440 [Candidatus Sumerlaeia bacterium]|nr:hypothetical protein [Candidatus Sumerlaeia bacterium]